MTISTRNQLLEEHDISAFSTYEREVGKLEKDDRFLLVHPTSRRQAFDDFLAEKAQGEVQEGFQILFYYTLSIFSIKIRFTKSELTEITSG